MMSGISTARSCAAVTAVGREYVPSDCEVAATVLPIPVQVANDVVRLGRHVCDHSPCLLDDLLLTDPVSPVRKHHLKTCRPAPFTFLLKRKNHVHPFLREIGRA